MRKLLVGAALAVASAGSWAVTTVIQPLVYSVEYDADYPRCCGVYSGYFSNINFGASDYSRGFAEFRINNLGALNLGFTLQSATLTFNFASRSANLPTNSFSLIAYGGDYSPSRSDISNPGYTVGTFSPFDITYLVPGAAFSVDVTLALINAYYHGDASFGVTSPTIPALASQPPFMYSGPGLYFGLNNFSLTIVSAATPVTAIPEPSTYALFVVGLAALAGGRRFHRRGS